MAPTCTTPLSQRPDHLVLKNGVSHRRYAIFSAPARQGGFALALPLALIGLLSAISLYAASITREPVLQKQVAELRTDVLSQLQLVRGRIIRCVINFPGGDNGTGTFVQFPAGEDVQVSSLTCPGAPSGADALWGGVRGAFLPLPPKNFDEWHYTLDATGVRVVLTPTSTTQVTTAVMSQVASKFRATEVSVVDGDLVVWINRA